MDTKHDVARFKKSMMLQAAEILKYKWILGVQLGHDPLLDRSMNSICLEWIQRYGEAFRKWWEKNLSDYAVAC